MRKYQQIDVYIYQCVAVALQEECHQIARAVVLSIISSMSDRCRACVAACGGHNREIDVDLDSIAFMCFRLNKTYLKITPNFWFTVGLFLIVYSNRIKYTSAIFSSFCRMGNPSIASQGPNTSAEIQVNFSNTSRMSLQCGQTNDFKMYILFVVGKYIQNLKPMQNCTGFIFL